MSTANISDKQSQTGGKAAGEDARVASSIDVLCTTAKKGLVDCYGGLGNPLPYAIRLRQNGEVAAEGSGIRYAAISQIGIAKWLRFYPEDMTCLPGLWARIVNSREKVTHAGDCALALWAGAASKADDCDVFARNLSEGWRRQADLCNAVELAWILQGCTVALRERDDLESYVRPMIKEVKDRLLTLFRPRQELFRRHNRPGLGHAVGRRIACFADQVYPILALSDYGQAFNDQQCIECAAAATQQICRFQGPLGQWWWHYDTREAKVCEEYPVFSVHQDSMAPMAIMASDRVSGSDHRKEIELGLRWLFGANELNENLVSSEAGTIWRDIEKREPAKASRALRALLCAADLRSLHRLAGKCRIGFRVNRECRPYHLGWILYAWADFGRRAGSD